MYGARSTSTKEKKLTSLPSRRSFGKRSPSTALANRKSRRNGSRASGPRRGHIVRSARSMLPLVLVAWATVAAGPSAVAGQSLSGVALARPWFSLGPSNLSGRIQSVTFDPTNASVVYLAAAGGGVWRSVNGGRDWIPIGDDLPSLTIGAIAVAPRDPRILIVGTGDPVIGNDWIVGAGIV